MDPVLSEKALIKERLRKIIALQRQVNEQVYRLSEERNGGDREIQSVLTEVVNRGNESIQSLARLLAVKCGT